MKDLKCPRCGNTERPFQIGVKVNVLVQKGSDDYDVIHSETTPDIHQLDLTGDSDCTCTECTYISSLGDFVE